MFSLMPYFCLCNYIYGYTVCTEVRYMRITRFVNGQRIEHSLDGRGIFVKNEAISDAIEAVKQRISASNKKEESIDE